MPRIEIRVISILIPHYSTLWAEKTMFRKKLTNSTQRIQNCWENTVKNPGKDGDGGERKGWKKTQKCGIMIPYYIFEKRRKK